MEKERSALSSLFNCRIVVQKYGGSSLQDLEHMKKVNEYIKEYVGKNKVKVLCVVSAMGDTTDDLLKTIYGITPNPVLRDVDFIIHTGETVSAGLMSITANSIGLKATCFTGAQIGLITEDKPGDAKFLSLENPELIAKAFERYDVIFIAGFQGQAVGKRGIRTVGRGGSDATAVALAAFLGLEECEIYTDVDGVYMVDPRYVPNAKRFPKISYRAMNMLAEAGAAVLMDRCVQIAYQHNVDIRVLCSPSKGESGGGTLVTSNKDITNLEEAFNVSGIALRKNMSILHIYKIPNEPGKAAEIFKAFADNGINIIDCVQGKADGHASMSVIIKNKNADYVIPALQKIEGVLFEKITDLAAVTLIDPLMREEAGYFFRISKCLSKQDINIELISSAQTSIMLAIDENKLKKAANTLAAEFGLIEK